MTIEEAIYHLQELADSKFEQMRRYDRASGYAISHNEDIRTADAKRLEQRAKECIQIAKWLKDYKRLKEQEPFKPMIEIDLDYVIKQKYIEREVLDKIRATIAEIPKKYPMTMDYENGLKEALAIIDKYKSESEDKENE